MEKFPKNVEMNESGFTMTELLVGTAISLILLGLVAGIIQSQSKTFERQSQLGQMQANGRAAVEFLSRSVQNAGYNVSRGKRFLAASDHYVTMVFDENDDGAIQNNEVMTYAVSNPDITDNETFTISPYFDQDGDGEITSSETRDYDISLALSSPPFHFYRIIPNKDDSGVVKRKVARDVDNIIIRFWDKDGEPLPSGVEVDSEGNPVPPYFIPDEELNEIRKVDMEIVTRSRDEDPNTNFINNGTYYSGSVATVGGSSGYNDRYHRETYSAVSAPRNLVTSPWGKINLTASPQSITCPDSSTYITANVLDGDGEGIGTGVTVNFNTSQGTVSPTSAGTFGTGSATTILTYDWASPSVTATLSANALIDIDGEDYPVFNAIPVSFNSGDGIFTDNFDDGNSDGWTEEGAANWNVSSQEYKPASNSKGLSSNGCTAWKNYETSIEIKRNGSINTGEYVGLVFRYQSYEQQYQARIYCVLCSGDGNNHQYVLELVNYNNGATVLSSNSVNFDNDEIYILKASVNDNTLSAKLWVTSEDEPDEWSITAADSSYAQGKIGIIVSTNRATFDNVAVNPL